MASSRVGTSTRAAIPGADALQQAVHDRNQERKRLAGAGLRGGENIFAFEGLRDRCGLHRSGRRETS